MKTNRIIQYVDLPELSDVEEFFRRHTGVDAAAADERYADAVVEGRRAIEEHCRVAMVYGRVGIESRGPSSVTLSDGHVLEGKMPARALEHSSEVYLFAMTVDGFVNFSSDDIMVDYFGDTWATAYIECAQAHLARRIGEELEKEGHHRTHVWCPGQVGFGLENQRVLFDILSPKDIDLTLSDALMMVPVKSASGIIGVMPEDAEESVKPCDYCEYRPTCPGSDRGCASL